MAEQTEEKIEDKAGLPVNHPEAGYLPPEPGASYNTGTLPPEEQEARDAAVKDYEAQKKAVEEHEQKVQGGEQASESSTQSTSKKTSASS